MQELIGIVPITRGRERERETECRGFFAQTLTSLFSKAESAIQLHTVHINHHKSMFWFSTKTLHIISTHQTQKTRPFEYINTSHKHKSLLQNLIWLSNRFYSPIKTLQNEVQGLHHTSWLSLARRFAFNNTWPFTNGAPPLDPMAPFLHWAAGVGAAISIKVSSSIVPWLSDYRHPSYIYIYR